LVEKSLSLNGITFLHTKTALGYIQVIPNPSCHLNQLCLTAWLWGGFEVYSLKDISIKAGKAKLQASLPKFCVYLQNWHLGRSEY
jgi:hypothetical protein